MRVHVDMMLVVRRVPVNTRPSVCTVVRDTVVIPMLQAIHLRFHSILVSFPRLHRHPGTCLLVDRKRLQYQQAINLHHPVRWYCRQPASVTLRHLGIKRGLKHSLQLWMWMVNFYGKESRYIFCTHLPFVLYYYTSTHVPSQTPHETL